ncbi:MAG: ABC transporter ATP-binding protein [Chloroflexota bacterium]
MNLLDVRDLEVVYDDAVIAVQGVSLTVPDKGIVAILGVNGAGKTTTLRAISGFLGVENAKVTDGTIELMGERLHNLLPHEIVKRGVALVPERNKVFTTLTVAENLLVPQACGKSDFIISPAEIYGYFPVLKERRSQVAGYLSGGERQMLAIGMALLNAPRLLLLDEPSLGLAPRVAGQLMETLVSIRKEMGISVLLVEQNTAALKIADYAYIMENGRAVFEGTPEKLSQHDDIREFYLGISEERLKSYREVKQYRRTRRWW